MDPSAKNRKPENPENNGHEQLSLDLNTAGEAAETAPQAEQKPDTPRNPLKKRQIKNKKDTAEQVKEGFLNIGVGSFGKYLQDMRVRSNYNISQVEQITRIKAKYIELLEMEKPEIELAPVFVMAYARKLCACYNVPEAETVGLMSELKSKMRESLPPEIMEKIKIDYEINEDNQRRMRNLAWLVLGTLAIFSILIAISIYIRLTPAAPPKTVKPETAVPLEKFDPEKLKVLQRPVMIEAGELPPKQ
ncbi:MAG: helix-turn-helix domain-containing protein [Victivallales bacterium]|nr:helix-turn-helix domain-containing protein [Victivallales bacterium]